MTTIDERIADTKAKIAEAVEARAKLNAQQQTLSDEFQKSERLCIKLDAELALLESLKAED